MPEPPSWVLETGLPSVHVARAALHVARIIDSQGSRVIDAGESYWHHASGGAFAPTDLELGEPMLLDLDLLVERDRYLFPTGALRALLRGTDADAIAVVAELAAEWTSGPVPNPPDADALADLVPDPLRREELLIALGRRFDDSLQRNVGEIGEDVVVDAAREELAALGHTHLVRDVRRVSLLSDQLGYDVSAPGSAAARVCWRSRARPATSSRTPGQSTSAATRPTLERRSPSGHS